MGLEKDCEWPGYENERLQIFSFHVSLVAGSKCFLIFGAKLKAKRLWKVVLSVRAR